jgi:hypothetical protein
MLLALLGFLLMGVIVNFISKITTFLFSVILFYAFDLFSKKQINFHQIKKEGSKGIIQRKKGRIQKNYSKKKRKDPNELFKEKRKDPKETIGFL